MLFLLRRHSIRPLAMLLAGSLFALPVAAQVDEDDQFRQGLVAHYRGDSGEACTRLDRTIAFAWGERPPDRRLGPGNFQARWRGYLMSQAPGEYRLYAHFAGRLQIKLDDRVVLEAETDAPAWRVTEPIELPFDYHPLEVAYQKTGEQARVALFWSGPQFPLEPISQRQFFHDAQVAHDQRFERGQSLVRALRCAACHEMGGESEPARAPALDRLADNIRAGWLVDWLADTGGGEGEPSAHQAALRRMPRFSFTPEQAEAIAAFLIDSSTKPEMGTGTARADRSQSRAGDGAKPKPGKVNRAAGEELLLALGCLACHQVGGLGDSGLFGGGDLSRVAAKRPPDFFARWLADPATVNRHHRMPVFELSGDEQRNLAAHLATLGTENAASGAEEAMSREDLALGRTLYEQNRCGACHDVADGAASPPAIEKVSLDAASDWTDGCAGEPDAQRPRPGYQLAAADREAVGHFFLAVARAAHRAEPITEGPLLLAEHNCLACHERDQAPGIASKLPEVAAAHTKLASLLPLMTPPPLTNIGDKLHDDALADAIGRRGDVRRPYLRIRMPKYKLAKAELDALVGYFVQTDRIPNPGPNGEPAVGAFLDDLVLEAAAGRLLTADGFGCTSCHLVGKTVPAGAEPHELAPDLSMLGRRVRRPWFDRFLHNPVRVVPRMEMPSVQVSVRGLLDDDLGKQLSAVWDVLNKPGFQPPKPNAVRVVRRSGIADRNERAAVITDVVRTDRATFVKPLLVGLPNRHNVLFDLETARLVGWSIGDVARQRTEGKSWYWEAAGTGVFQAAFEDADLSLVKDGREQQPIRVGQFPTEFDWLEHVRGGLAFRYRLRFSDESRGQVVLAVNQTFSEVAGDAHPATRGLRREVEITGVPGGWGVRLRLLASSQFGSARLSEDARTILLDEAGRSRIQLVEPHDTKLSGGAVLSSISPDDPSTLRFQVQYLTELPVDRFPLVEPEPSPWEPVTMNVVPGFEAVRLPVTDELMPSALAWRPDGVLVVASLKGRVWLARDTDGDELEDRIWPFSDELAAPYGLATGEQYIDVSNKYALLRLFDDDDDGRVDRTVSIASGWGHTTDYHDWAIGLPRDEQGNYYIGLPCQQDQRSQAAAHLRGRVIKLVPRGPTAEDPRWFGIEPISAGHRFPMGLARNREGALFVTDNQGNYNPFNELNHVVPGAHFGFINLLERQPGFQPPLVPPAIDIPHPWTRSVNGIFFLDTPPALKRKRGRDVFGPLEGHLVGCEYDTRRLIRMSLQKVGQTYQGAAYPLSYDEPPSGPPFLGPIVGAVAPDGDVYIGSIRDSGWGGANNVGELVRLRLRGESLPCGIAEVRAMRNGFVIDFTAPVDRGLAGDVNNYSVSSYTRVSTPAYGGPDQDRRVENIVSVEVAEDARRAVLALPELRAGYVYEIRLKNLAGGGRHFFPAEAHYTVRTIEKGERFAY